MTPSDRPEVPEQWIERIRQILVALPECEEEPAWTGTRWRVGGATVAHIFGGHDQLFRITFRATPDEVMAFQYMGEPYFVVGGNSVGMLVDEHTDWPEVAESLIDSYRIQAPSRLVDQLERP